MLRYSREIDLDDTNNAHSLGVLSVPPGSRVLDIGPGGPHIGRALRERDCKIWAVEVDPVAAHAAEEHCERVVIADVETLELGDVFEGLTFDVVLLLDVLEHLRDPAAVLRDCRPLLAEDGRVVASIPNVAHAAVRLELLGGRFRYRETGLLDRTHIRFFDTVAVDELFTETGYSIDEKLRVTRGIAETEVGVDLEEIPEEVVAAATADPEATTYQFILVASPAGENASAPRLPREATLLERMQRDREELLKQIDRAHEEARREREELEEALRRQGDEVERAFEERELLQRDVAIKDEYIADLRARIEAGRPLPQPVTRLADPLAATRYRMVDAVNDWVRRVPGLHNSLRWAAKKAATRRR